MRRVNGIYVRQTNKTNNCSFIFINLKNTFAAQYIFCAYAAVYAERRRGDKVGFRRPFTYGFEDVNFGTLSKMCRCHPSRSRALTNRTAK